MKKKPLVKQQDIKLKTSKPKGRPKKVKIVAPAELPIKKQTFMEKIHGWLFDKFNFIWK
jgi:hypothetical protein